VKPIVRVFVIAAIGVGLSGPATAQAENSALSAIVDGLKQGGILVPSAQQCPAFWIDVAPDEVVAQNGTHFRICKLDPSITLNTSNPTPSNTPDTPQTQDGAQLQAQVMATWYGTFDTSFGITHLQPNASRGDYAYSNGRITVTYVDGTTMKGTWEQDKSSKQCADGRFYGHFIFQASANGFTGTFGYCDDAPGVGVWNGTKQ
jgi:hypothetical protein